MSRRNLSSPTGAQKRGGGNRARTRGPNRDEIVLVTRTVLCSVCGVSEGQLMVWEHEDLVAPARIDETRGRVEPLYDRESIRRVRVIRTLAEELEVNLAGIGVILHLLDQIAR
jgi:MerR-like DNA binding protein